MPPDVEVADAPSNTQVDAARPFWSMPELTGENYLGVLQRFHQIFKPETYFEIGVNKGATLELSTCASVGIDPRFKLSTPLINNKPYCCLYNMTSDAFFKKHSATQIFGQPIDMAFLDGMHWFEYLLRDFIGTERHCKTNSVIFLHDCIPTDEHVGRRYLSDDTLKKMSAHPAWWAGDVWKVLSILYKYRPDLKIVAFDARPTGLIAVTSLDPTSTTLSDNYYDIVDEYKHQTIAEGGALADGRRLLPAREFALSEGITSMFWL